MSTNTAYRFLLLISISTGNLVIPSSTFSQEHKNKIKEVIAISAGSGVLTFHGDVGANSLAGPFSFIRSGYSFAIEKNFNKNFCASLTFMKGKIARDEKASDNIPQMNFESPLIQAGVTGTYLIAGKNEPAVIPFLSAGISYVRFDPHGDLLDKNGKAYYYWKDGSIRDLPESYLNYFYAKNIDRDYTYETKLTDSAISYARATFSLPLSLGVKMKLTPHLDVNLAYAYHLSFSDYLDNIKASANDAYIFSSVSLTWHVFTMTKEERKKYSKPDFSSMDMEDTDKDGVLDEADLCPATPEKVPVDIKGCPIDSDKDGVPDYQDQEQNSKSNLPVDINGVSITKERMLSMYKESNATDVALRGDVFSDEFNKNPSAEFMKQIEEMQKKNPKNQQGVKSNSIIPHDLRVADWNKDGLISSEEIAKTIDSFFDGSIIFSTEQINRLVDFFFEQ